MVISNLETKNISEITDVGDLKMVSKIILKWNNLIGIRTQNGYIININKNYKQDFVVLT